MVAVKNAQCFFSDALVIIGLRRTKKVLQCLRDCALHPGQPCGMRADGQAKPMVPLCFRRRRGRLHKAAYSS